jgi:hypothetical protein
MVPRHMSTWQLTDANASYKGQLLTYTKDLERLRDEYLLLFIFS